MELTKKQRYTKYICFGVMLVLAELLQNISGLLPEILSARCFIMIPALIVIVIGEEEIPAAVIGLLSGMLWDLTSGVHLGFNCIFFAVLCFGISALMNRLLRDTFITNMLMCAIGTILYCIIYWLCFIVIKGINGAQNTIFTFYLPCAVYTMAITPIVYAVIKSIKKRLQTSKSPAAKKR